MEGTTIAVIGGGPWLPRLVDEMHRQLPASEDGLRWRFCARDGARLAVVVEHIRRRLTARGRTWPVEATTSLADAVEAADIVVLMVRVGGGAARRHDETFPIVYGLAGDEGLGPGGFANAWRTVPFVRRFAATVRERSPGARVLNLVAPLGITTRCLVDAGVDAVGLCELPIVVRRRLDERLVLDGVAPSLAYLGLNHLGWFWPTDDGTREAVFERRVLDVDDDVLAAYGAIPLPYFDKLFRRRPVPDAPARADELAALADGLVRAYTADPGLDTELLDRRPMPWFDESVVPVVRSVVQRRTQRAVVDVPNTTSDGELAVGILPPRSVVEVFASFHGDGRLALDVPSDPPAPVRSFLTRLAEAEGLAYGAAHDRDRDLMAAALAAHPLDLDRPTVAALLPHICQDAVASPVSFTGAHPSSPGTPASGSDRGRQPP
ncbi:MAG: hypothetical protein H0U21_04105 [Acidimicrobiia bacterium]|nr:hypothetical protein [Acidimicrobiia bacterium]